MSNISFQGHQQLPSGESSPSHEFEETNYEGHDDEEERSMALASVFGSVANSLRASGDEQTHDGTVALTPGELQRLGDVFGHGFGNAAIENTSFNSHQPSEQEHGQATVGSLFSSPSSQQLPPITFTQYSEDSKHGDESPAGSASQDGQRRISFAPSTKPGVSMPTQNPMEADEGGGGGAILSLLTNPMEYIFGGADDEVSEMGGTFFNDASSLWGGASLQSKSLATRRSLNSGSQNNTRIDSSGTFPPARDARVTPITEPIYEVDEESETHSSSRASNKSAQRSTIGYDNSRVGATSVASKSLYSDLRDREDRSQASPSFAPSRTNDDRSAASSSFASGKKSAISRSTAASRKGATSVMPESVSPTFRDIGSIARSQTSLSVASSGKAASRKMEETGSQYSMGSFAKHDDVSKATAAVTEASTTRFVGDSFGSSSHSDDFRADSAYNPEAGYNADTQTLGSSYGQAEGYGPSVGQGFGAASTGFDGYSYDQGRSMLLSKQASIAAMSCRSMNSSGSDVFQLHPDGPLMTRSPSGRAVVHVALRSDREGSINKLEYTKPQMDTEPIQKSSDHTTRERSIRSQHRSVASGDSYSYYTKQNPIPPIAQRKWARAQAMMFLLALAAAAVTISTFSTMGDGNIGRNTSASSQGASSSTKQGQSSPTSPNTPTSPSAPTSSSTPTAPVPAYAPTSDKNAGTIPEPLSSSVMDWVSKDGKIPDITLGIPFYWSFPLCGASLLQYVFGTCFGFVQASEVGATSVSNKTLSIVQVGPLKYVNVDTTTLEGLDHASTHDLVPSKLANIIYSPFLHEAIQALYTSQNQARLIVTLRDPIDYAVGLYHYLRAHPSDPRYSSALATMSMEQFATSSFLSNNLVTRALVNKMAGGLSNADLELAKLILSQKAIVGVYDDLAGALHRIENYFQFSTFGNIANCSAQTLQSVMDGQYVKRLDEGSTAYSLLLQRNQYDIQLYNYVRTVLAKHQDEFLASLMKR